MKYPMVAAAIKMHFQTQKHFALVAGHSELEVSQILHGGKPLSEMGKGRWAKLLQTPKAMLFPDQERKED